MHSCCCSWWYQLDNLLMGLKEKDYKFKTTKRNGLMFNEPDELVINVGDMLSRHTNNKWNHQVVNPPENYGELQDILYRFHAPSDMPLNWKKIWCRKSKTIWRYYCWWLFIRTLSRFLINKKIILNLSYL
jgi:hypothetical protein